jgi:biotin synthase
MRLIINKLEKNQILCKEEFKELLINLTDDTSNYLFECAQAVRRQVYGNDVYMRGLIEVTNYCKNDCYYCGIRKSNCKTDRYRLTIDQILECCQKGYNLGLRTFVLQGGEDGYFTDEKIVKLVQMIKTNYPDSAVTLSMGEKSFDSYKSYFEEDANRYLIRHKTANVIKKKKIHPDDLSFESRMECLTNLKKIGFQTGCGFMVGSPFQTVDNLIEDLMFIKSFNPHMVGIGPFIPHHDTPFSIYNAGSIHQTLVLLAIVRLMLPQVLLPATTALGTIHSSGYEKGILAGANVVMPNLSPLQVRSKYLLYDNKINTKDETFECIQRLEEKIERIGYHLVVSRGDYKCM